MKWSCLPKPLFIETLSQTVSDIVSVAFDLDIFQEHWSGVLPSVL